MRGEKFASRSEKVAVHGGKIAARSENFASADF